MKNSLKVTLHGATRTVTGSRYLVETDNKKILIDCGLFQGPKELRLRNWDIPSFDPKSIDAVVLTHAHIDHTGYLPVLSRLGFNGPIFCTEATKKLLALLLEDSAHLQEEEAEFANRHKTSKHHPAKPLYDARDIFRTLNLTKVFTRDNTSEILPGINLNATCAGHILGSVSLSLEVAGRRITFSGDVGRFNSPILPDPAPHNIGDILLCEATYGDREHPKEEAQSELLAVIKSAITNNGAIIIPAFALGRTQNILYHIAELERKALIPAIPVYVDSPMAVDATKIYQSFQHDYDSEAKALIAEGEKPLLPERIKFCKSVNDSKALNEARGSRIIISASGMATGGRILHHLKYNLSNEKNTILLVGYQAEGTRGHSLQTGCQTLKIFGEFIPVRAKIKNMSGLSAHADKNELVRWLKSCSGSPKAVRIIHAEEKPADEFSKILKSEFAWNVKPGEYLETVEV